jgi:hypothetical protein
MRRQSTTSFWKASALDLDEIIVKWRHAPYGTSEDQVQVSQQMQVTNEWQHRSTNDRRHLNQIAALKSTKSVFS